MKRALLFVVTLWILALGFAAHASAATIYVRNISSVYTTTQLQLDVAAINDALTFDFNPVWGTNTRLVFSQVPPLKSQVIAVTNKDNSSPGALGYHAVAKGAIPFGAVLAQTTLEANRSVSVTLAHEAFEMAVDPLVNDWVRVSRYSTPFYLQETGDPVESDKYAYTRNGVLISDFVLPNWFRAGSPGPWDFTRHTARPLQILPGGYQIAWSRLSQSEVHVCAPHEFCRRK